MTIHKGRHVARIDGDFVVFLIGMRINKPWKLREWAFVFRAMPRMIKELEAAPDSGSLGATQGLWTTGPSLVQYWRSFEALERYARDPDAEHLPAWREFNQRVRGSGDVGIWHETYRLRAGEYEAIYGNMPRVGLAAVGQLVPVGSTTDTAALRIGADGLGPRAVHGPEPRSRLGVPEALSRAGPRDAPRAACRAAAGGAPRRPRRPRAAHRSRRSAGPA